MGSDSQVSEQRFLPCALVSDVVGCDEANATVRGDNLTFRTP